MGEKIVGFLRKMGNGSSASPSRVSPWQLECHSEHEGSINCMALSEDMSVLATGSDDGTVRLWTTTTGRTQCLGVLRGHKKYITCLSLDGGYLVSGSADKTVKKWDVSTGQCTFTYEGHTGMVNRLISTGDFIFTSSYDGTARCWVLDADPSLGYDPCVRVFRGHKKGVYPLVFIPAGEEESEEDSEDIDLLITGSGDGTARSWSVETGKCRAAFVGHQGPVHSLAVNPEGSVLFTGSTDGTIRSWNIEKAEGVVVKAVDMPDSMKDSAVDACLKALEESDQEKEIAGHIKKTFDQLHGPTWHCVVGRNFGSFVSHEQERFIYLYVKKHGILLFKSA